MATPEKWGVWCEREDGTWSDWLRRKDKSPPDLFDSVEEAEAAAQHHACPGWKHHAHVPFRPGFLYRPV